ncbi:MAG: tRNA (adenosine(37)-N6)-dimethylallyltransferase MiaA [Gammaproteobacteria bacterium]|jgi:tRNA dimethylallyltransferase
MGSAGDSDRPSCVCLTGPTACGKTELALKIAARIPLEIVSMDSALVYRGMDIGTAKPSADVRAIVPHHLIDIADAADTYSAGRFVRDAGVAIRDIAARGRLPLLVGGTHLYLRALRDGLANLPQADASIRRRLDAEAAAEGWPALHGRLAGVDPEAAARIAPSDGQRIQRALEVYELTGEALSVQQRRSSGGDLSVVTTLALLPDDREALAGRIEQRFDAMVEAGFVEEVTELKARDDLTSATPAMRAVGYRQIWSYLDGEFDWHEARARALASTRQLAKRQLTSLRSDSNAEYLAAASPDIEQTLIARVREELA